MTRTQFKLRSLFVFSIVSEWNRDDFLAIIRKRRQEAH